MHQSDVFPVVLCGGSGTRLWPLSRRMYPKQFIPMPPQNTHSFLQVTCQRLAPAHGYGAPTLICHTDHRFLVADQMGETAITPRHILLEPEARNTAPAIASATLAIAAENPDAVIAVMPSDHVVADEDAFRRATQVAAQVARDGNICLFGIVPDEPHTGFGYIEAGQAQGAHTHKVRAFREKPDAATAARYLAAGNYFWNGGIFIFSAQTMLNELAEHAPEVLAGAEQAVREATPDLSFVRLGAEGYAKAPQISIDYAVMEKTDRAVVTPLDAGWSDVGAWSAMHALHESDADGNVAAGDAVLTDSRNTFVHAGGERLVTTLGVDDLVVVDTPDAVLVTKRDASQQVGDLVKSLAALGRAEPAQHNRNHRPWGFFEQLGMGDRFQVKLLHVKPGGQLSLQMHHHRSEHWVVVRGTAQVTCGDDVRFVRENESIYISATEWHRLENPGKVPLEVIEVQIGAYLQEDDIIRSEDRYQRGAQETG
ncbi:MAG: mannose-1-phosphate guanylyltransferase/mannose-6-phosphate isomerase [Pseudomonadota bacterium]